MALTSFVHSDGLGDQRKEKPIHNETFCVFARYRNFPYTLHPVHNAYQSRFRGVLGPNDLLKKL